MKPLKIGRAIYLRAWWLWLRVKPVGKWPLWYLLSTLVVLWTQWAQIGGEDGEWITFVWFSLTIGMIIKHYKIDK